MTTEYRRILLDGYPILTTRHGDALVTRDGRSIGVDEAVHLAPCNPSKIICVHLNYHSRVQEFITKLPPAPTYFHKPITALNTHKGAVVRPERCNWLNYEGEIAIVIGKQVFGGVGQNVFNPAMVARVALLVSFPVPLTQWVFPLPLTSLAAPDFIHGLQIFLGNQLMPDAMASASLLGYTKTEMSRGIDLLHSLAGDHAPVLSWIGTRSGSFGESASLLILGGGLYLLACGIITWHTPVAVLAGLAIPAAIGHAVDPTHYLSVSAHLLSGAAMLGAFFIATDYVTSPNTASGQIVFGLGVGFLTWVIRTWGAYPEGMAFAVLLMNALTPVIDRFVKPRILGRDRKGRALDIPESKGV